MAYNIRKPKVWYFFWIDTLNKQANEQFKQRLYPAGNYMFKVNNKNTRTKYDIFSGVVLVSLLLALNIFHTLF